MKKTRGQLQRGHRLQKHVTSHREDIESSLTVQGRPRQVMFPVRNHFAYKPPEKRQYYVHIRETTPSASGVYDLSGPDGLPRIQNVAQIELRKVLLQGVPAATATVHVALLGNGLQFNATFSTEGTARGVLVIPHDGTGTIQEDYGQGLVVGTFPACDGDFGTTLQLHDNTGAALQFTEAQFVFTVGVRTLTS